MGAALERCRSCCRQAWTDEAIRSRTDELAEIIVKVWPVPAGHRSGFSEEKARPRRKFDLSDLINAGLLAVGMTLFPRRKRFAGKVATLLPDGQIDVDGTLFSKPRHAASEIAGKPTTGWSFFLVDHTSRRSLRDVRRDYVDALAVDLEDEEADDDGDEDES